MVLLPTGSSLRFRPVTRAEAVVIVQRLLDVMTRGLDPELRLVVNGFHLSVVTPDGNTVKATPAVTVDPETGRPFILVNGVATFTFTPALPGTYQYKLLFHLPGSAGQLGRGMEASAQSTIQKQLSGR